MESVDAILPETSDAQVRLEDSAATDTTAINTATSSTTDPVDIAPLTRPDTSTMLSDTAAVLAASSTISDTTDHHQNAFYVQLRRLAMIVFTIFFTDSTRQTYKLIFAHIRTNLVTFPPNYSHFVLVVIIFASIAEYQQPGCIPRLSALFGFACAATVFFSCLACLEFVEERKWPWQEDGWVWPWEAWLWRDTVYELGASTSSELMP
jgi:hypothetical protein